MCSPVEDDFSGDEPMSRADSTQLRTSRTLVCVEPDRLDLVIVTSPDATIRFELAGEVCTLTAPKLRGELLNWIPPGRWDVELDLAAVDFIDSRGVALLLDIARHSSVRRLSTSHASRVVERVFRICGLDEVLTIRRQ